MINTKYSTVNDVTLPKNSAHKFLHAIRFYANFKSPHTWSEKQGAQNTWTTSDMENCFEQFPCNDATHNATAC